MSAPDRRRKSYRKEMRALLDDVANIYLWNHDDDSSARREYDAIGRKAATLLAEMDNPDVANVGT